MFEATSTMVYLGIWFSFKQEFLKASDSMYGDICASFSHRSDKSLHIQGQKGGLHR